MRTTLSGAMLVLLGLVGWVQGQAPRGVQGQAPPRGVPGQALPRGVVPAEVSRPVAMAKPVNGVITYTYYAGSTPTGPPLPGPPVDAGTYTVVATFKSADGNFTGASTATTFTMQKATPQLKLRHGGGTYNGAP